MTPVLNLLAGETGASGALSVGDTAVLRATRGSRVFLSVASSAPAAPTAADHHIAVEAGDATGEHRWVVTSASAHASVHVDRGSATLHVEAAS